MGSASALVTMVLRLESAGAPRCPDGLGRARCTYVRRQPEQTVLHRVVREHLETFLAEARLRGTGEGLPRFVERELREYVTCGSMARGLRASGAAAARERYSLPSFARGAFVRRAAGYAGHVDHWIR